MDFSALIGLIKTRRSIRVFTEEPLPREGLEELIIAGQWAPSGSNAQAWEAVIVDEPALMNRFVAFLPGVSKTPAAMIWLCLDREREAKRGGKLGLDSMGALDIAMAAQNMLLAIEAKGWGGCVIKGFNEKIARLYLKLPEQVTPELMIILGKPEQPGKVISRRPLAEILHWQHW